MSTADEIERRITARWAWLRRRRLYRLLGGLLERRTYRVDPRLQGLDATLDELAAEVDRHSEQLEELERRASGIYPP